MDAEEIYAAIKPQLDAEQILAELLAEIGVKGLDLNVVAHTAFARFARHEPAILLCYPDQIRESSVEDEMSDLFTEWVDLLVGNVADRSGDMTRDWGKVRDRAIARASALGIAWSDEMLPDYVRDALGMEEPDG